MKKLQYRELSLESFAPFGSYASMIDPATVRIGAPPVEFYRDMIQAGLGPAQTASFGVCRVTRRPYVINVSEYHNGCPEVIMPLDGDVLIHAAPAVPEREFPADLAAVFRVPKNTLVVLRPGVWHHGPYTIDTPYVNCLVMLPERTYMNDCAFYDFPESEWIEITGPGLA
ncbi:ureidoglycolate lyase [Salinispira pacifica]